MIDLAPLDRHEKIALCLSGGKDSLAVLWLLRDHLHRVTVYHLDTGDLLPEIMETVARVAPMCSDFVHIRRDVRGWIARNGYPTDLLPYSTHGIGVEFGQNGEKMVTRYQCCFHNLMWPMWERVRADGVTLCIRGSKTADPIRLPALTGDAADGIEIWLPIANWSHADVMAYLRDHGAPVPSLYDHMTNAPECARCTAWWGEGRAGYLRDRHPDLYRDYMRDLRRVAAEIAGPVSNLRRELGAA